MQYVIAHELPGRIRLGCGRYLFDPERAAALEHFLLQQNGLLTVRVSSITGSVLITFWPAMRDVVLQTISRIDLRSLPRASGVGSHELDIAFERDMIGMAMMRLITRYLLPAPLRTAYTLFRAWHVVKKGIAALLHGELNVNVLDASAVSAALATRNSKTAGSIVFMLRLCEKLEGYTRKKSRDVLANSLSLNIDAAWRVTDGEEILTPIAQLRRGDLIVVRGGAMIPLDGQVASGDAMVCQASLTGETMPLHRVLGDSVYAGTVVEEGALTIAVTNLADDTRISKILSIIDESEQAKSLMQGRAENLANSIVPFSFLGAALTLLLTGNPLKATGLLMVDYSCAIKLATPIAVLSAMREAAQRRAFVKGGRYLEAFAEADTIVFDKTGTLTRAEPRVHRVIPLGDLPRNEVLRIAACLEEHYPHSLARAIVRQAEVENLKHREEHGELEYVVAHGVAAHYKGKRAIIGSRHFVFDDEKIVLTAENQAVIDREAEGLSAIYLALDDKLLGLITIEDPVRENAAKTIADLKALGIRHAVMITGDGRPAASRVAAELGLTEFYAEVLPQDKSDLIEALKREGRTVIMVGDGVNDSPALAKADVGIAMMEGCDLAREVADVVLLSSELEGLVLLRRLSQKLVGRISSNYRRILWINTSLLLLSLFGVITPGMSAILHNISTFGISASAAGQLMPAEVNVAQLIPISFSDCQKDCERFSLPAKPPKRGVAALHRV